MGIRVQDVAFVRLSAPDLDAMEEFLRDFGMVRADRRDDVLYMRGLDPDPFLHVTHRGAPGFVGLAFEAASTDDVERLAKAENAILESNSILDYLQPEVRCEKMRSTDLHQNGMHGGIVLGVQGS